MERNRTQLESFDSIRSALSERSFTNSEQHAGRQQPTMLEANVSSNAEGVPVKFRPTQRPPMAVITMLYDGLDDGDCYGVWKGSCVVGRVDSDINVPHDPLVSSKHFELYLPEKPATRWRIRDRESTNGTFVRIADAILVDEMEFLVGCHRYRFLDVDSAASKVPQKSEVRNTTQAWQMPTIDDERPVPAVVEVTPMGIGEKVFLKESETFIGTDSNKCDICASNDKFVDIMHARIYQDEHLRWHLANCSSLNGTWVKIEEIPLDKNAQIQAGEQRFSVSIL